MAESFTSNEAIEWFHDVSRLGRGNEAHKLFSKEDIEINDYISGVVILSVFLLILLVTWFSILLAFRRLGPSNVGFLSGHQMVQRKSNNKKCNLMDVSRLVRFLFVLCALNVLIFCGIVVTKGSIHFDNTVESLQIGALGVEGLLSDSLDVFEELVTAGSRAQELRDTSEKVFADFCKGVNKAEVFGVDLNIKEVSNALGEMGDFMVDEGISLQSTVESLYDMLLMTNDALAFISSFKGSIAYIVLPISFLSAVLIAGTMLASSGYTSTRIEYIQSRIIIPLLLIVSIIFWVSASIFGLIAIVNADVCLGGRDPPGPDGTLYEILEIFNLQDNQPYVYDVIRYYIERCETRDPFIILEEYGLLIDEGTEMLDLFLESVDDVGTQIISQNCGHDVTEEIMVVRDLQGVLNSVEVQAGRALEIIECSRIHSIYVEVVHNGTCTNLPWATLWIFVSLLVIGICGMMMITLRSSFLKVHTYVTCNDDDAPEMERDTLAPAPQSILAHASDETSNE